MRPTSIQISLVIFSGSVTEAASGCSALNMSLLAMEDAASVQTYLPFLKKLPSSLFWTSASSEGVSCDAEKWTFTWCSTGKVVDDTIINDVVNGSESCVALGLNSDQTRAQLSLAACEQPKLFICQSALFYNGALVSPKNYGIWADVCGGKFLFGNKIVTWEQNVQKCCSLGMTPIIFNNAKKQKCLSKYTQKNWTGNLNYWTGGMQGCRGTWGWCAGATFVPIAENLTWALDQPELLKDKDNCLHMRIFKNDSSTALSDRNCSDKYIYACEGLLRSVELINAPSCPNTCSKEPGRFSSDGTVISPFLQGDWYTTCGKHLFFPHQKATWKEAWNYCCAFDMMLLSVETTMRHTCLSKFAKRYDPVVNVEHWTSGTDEGSDDKYMWCGNKLFLNTKDVNWNSGQPNSADGNCIYVQFSDRVANKTFFSTGNCLQKRKFICERNQVLPEGDLMQAECMTVYDVTSENIRAIKSNPSNLPPNLKCFIKCIGELKGLLLFGSLNLPIDALLVIEEKSPTPEEMQKNMAVVDECGTPPEGVDECSAAAGIYDCGKKKAPEITNAMENSLIISSSTIPALANVTYPVLATNYRDCWNKDLPCTVNTSLQQQLQTTGSTLMGSMITASNGRKFFKSNRMADNTMTYRAMFDYCCSLGMKQPEFLTLDDLQIFKTNGIVNGDRMQIGPIYVDGQKNDVWCDSKKPINLTMFSDLRHINEVFFSTVTTCFKLYYQDTNSKLLLHGSGECLPSALNVQTHAFLCE